MDGIHLILKERQRQIHEEGWTAEHDKRHSDGELALAAACYAMPKEHIKYRDRVTFITLKRFVLWPWRLTWWKPTPDDRIRELTKAGALIAAEIDRLLALSKKKNKDDEIYTKEEH
jgi:hypothetical protein